MSKNKSQILVNLFLLIISLVYSFQFLSWSIWLDAVYYFNILPFWRSNCMTIVTLGLGQLWCNCFGHTIFNLRVLNWLVCACSLFYVYVSFVEKKEWLKKLYYLAIGFLVMGYGNKNMYNPDTWTTCSCVLLGVKLLSMKNNCSILPIKDLISLSLLSAFAALCRFPNIVVLIILPAIILIISYLNSSVSKQLIRQLFTYILSSVIVYLFLLGIFSQKINVFSFIKDAFINQPFDPGHTYKHMLLFYWLDFYRTMKEYIGPIVILLIGFVLAKRFQLQKLGGLIIGAIVAFYFCRMADLHCSFSWYKYISISLFLLLLYFSVRNFVINRDNKEFSPLFILLGCAVINIAGSDTGIQNIFPFSAIFIPYLLEKYFKGIKIPQYFKIALLFLIPTQVYASLTNNFMFAKINKEQYEVPESLSFKNITVNEQQSQLFNNLLEDANKYGKKDHLIFYGLSCSHYMYALTGSKMLYCPSFWMRDYWADEIEEVKSIMKQDPRCVLFYEYDNYNILGEDFEMIAKIDHYYILKSVCNKDISAKSSLY